MIAAHRRIAQRAAAAALAAAPPEPSLEREEPEALADTGTETLDAGRTEVARPASPDRARNRPRGR